MSEHASTAIQHQGDVAVIELPDGTKVRAIEVEVETRYEGPSYLGRDVPYVVPVDWRNGCDDIAHYTVRLFAVIDEGQEGRP